MALTKAERLLGRIALERGIVGPDALARAIEAKERTGTDTARGAPPAAIPPGGDLTDVLVALGAITRDQQRGLLAAAGEIARRRATVKWAVAQAGKSPDEDEFGSDQHVVVEGEGSWAGVGSVKLEAAPEGSVVAPLLQDTLRSMPTSRLASGSREGAVAAAMAGATTPAIGVAAAPATPPPAPALQPKPGSGVEEDLAVAKIAMERGLVTLAEVREALQAQADFAAIGRPLPLGQVLIKRRALDVDTFLEIAREARDRSVRCGNCQVLSLMPRAGDLPPGAKGRCPRCGATLPLRRAGGPASPGPGAAHAASISLNPKARGVPERPPPPPSESDPGAAGPPPPLAPPPPTPGSGGSPAVGGTPTPALPPSGPNPAVVQAPPPAAADAAAPPPAPRRGGETLAGKSFGRYDVLAEIARGGMGVVYRAKDKPLGRVVALKVLKDGVAASEKQVRRFKRETEACAKLRHPNIVPIFDVGCEAGRHFFTMEFVDGVPLDEMIRRGPLEVPRALLLAEQIAQAMHHAHQAGIIHRDLKPANVILDKKGVPKITDFGLAKNVDHVSVMTKTGAAVGTPFYMPPEQAKGDAKKVDHRVDVYAIGVVLYEMLTTELPFDGETTLEVYHKILQDEAPSPSRLNVAVDADTDLIVRKAMAKERDDRYVSALALAEDIRRKLDGKPIHARAPGKIAVAARRVRKQAPKLAIGVCLAGLLAFSAIGLYFWRQGQLRARSEQAVKEDLDGFQATVRARLATARQNRLRAMTSLAERRPAEALDYLNTALASLAGSVDWAGGSSGVRLKDRNLAAARAFVARLEVEEVQPLVRDIQLGRGHAIRDGAIEGERGRAEALAAYEAALAIEGNLAEAHLERGRLLSFEGRFDEAIKAFGAAIEVGDRSPQLQAEALLGRGDAHARRGDLEAALKDYLALEELEVKAAGAIASVRFRIGEDTPSRYSTAVLRRAETEAALGRTAEALATVTRLKYQDPGLFQAYLVSGAIRRAQGDLGGAKIDADAAKSVRGQRPEGFHDLGLAYLESGFAAAAKDQFEEAIRRQHDFAPSSLYLGIALDRLGKRKEAEKALAAARDAPRASPEVRAHAALRIGEFDRRDGLLEAAVHHYQTAIRLDPRLGAAHVARARLRARTGELEGASRDLARARELKTDPAAVENAQGLVDLASDPEKAAQAFQRAVELAPDKIFSEAAANAGRALLKLGRPREARAWFEAALVQEAVPAGGGAEARAPALLRTVAGTPLGAARPDAEAAAFYRMAVAARNEPGEAAFRAFSRAVEVFPEHARAQLELARIHRENKALEKALASARAAVQANPFYADALVLRGAIRGEEAELRSRGAPFPKDAAADSRADFEAALAIEPDRPDALAGLARALNFGGDRDGALVVLERVIHFTAGKDDAGARRLLASAYDLRGEINEAAGRKEEGAADRARASELRSANRQKAEKLHDEGVDLLRTSGREAEAAARFSEAIEADRTYAPGWQGRAAARFNQADLLGAALDMSRALEIDARYADDVFRNASEQADALDVSDLYRRIAEVLKESPDDVPAMFLQGLHCVVTVYLGKGGPKDIEAGLATLDRVVRLSPRHAFAYVCRGYLRQAKGNLNGALEDVHKAEHLSDQSALAPFLTAVVLAKQGRMEPALSALERAVTRGFRGPERITQEKAFDTLRGDPRFLDILRRATPPPAG